MLVTGMGFKNEKQQGTKKCLFKASCNISFVFSGIKGDQVTRSMSFPVTCCWIDPRRTLDNPFLTTQAARSAMVDLSDLDFRFQPDLFGWSNFDCWLQLEPVEPKKLFRVHISQLKKHIPKITTGPFSAW